MSNKWRKTALTALKAVLWIAGIWLALLIILETVLSGSVLTGLVNRYASEYIDGKLEFGNVSASMFRRFPNVTLTLEDFSITYPADRFDEKEKEGVQGHLMRQGCGEERDTLASFRRFSAALNIPAILAGTIDIPYVRLDKPRVFAHSYHDGSANWDMFMTGNENEPEDSTEASGTLPKIVLGKILMTGHPHIVYTDSRDTVFALVNISKVGFNGRINTRRASRSKIGLTVDSMLVAGRVGRDTVSVGIERLYMHDQDRHVSIDAAAKAYMATRAFGRMMVPVNISGDISFPRDTVPAVKAENVIVNIAYIPINADAELKFGTKAISVKADIGIEKCKVGELLDKYADNFMPELSEFSTDMELTMHAGCEGEYDSTTGKKPRIAASLSIPESGISHKAFPGQEVRIGAEIDGKFDSNGKTDVILEKVTAAAKGLDIIVEGKLKDLLGADPELDIDAGMFADIDSLAAFLPDSMDITASGALEAHLKGKARLSQLNVYNFSQSSLTGEVLGEGITVDMPSDTIKASVDGLKLTLRPEEKSSRKSNMTVRLMGITGEIGTADISYKGLLEVQASGFRAAAKNIMDTKVSADTSRILHPFGGSISAQKLRLKDSEGSTIRIDSTWNGFQLLPRKGQSDIPVLTFNSRNGKIFMKTDANRVMVTDADISAKAVLNTVERKRKMKAFRDSLARVYPDVPKDSLFRHMMAMKGPRKQMPEWMKEDDFSKQDIDISLDKTLAGYFRDWDLDGSISVGKGMLMTPYFPLRNNLKGFDLKFTNDRVSIDRLAIAAGQSDLSVKGELTGLKRALLGRRSSLKLKADINSDRMNANQLLAAYAKGSSFNPDKFQNKEEVSDEEFLEDIVIDSTDMVEQTPLIVIPANLNADISLNASDIRYSSLHIDKVNADLVMKERCLQISNTKADSNMGEISLEGFYATRSKKDIKTGFNLNFKDITAEKVISLMPSIDTIMPLLKSFGGQLDCELAATADIDTNMNIMMPSIDGIIRIGGENLTIKENEMFRSIAKLLLFKNKKEGRIDKMTVEGIINDSKLEVFPFILEMDRYTLGLSGVQNMDMSFRYHASLIKSPFLIKVGIDLYGPDFDNMKFKIGKAKYKNTDVPVFTAVIDETKVNLVKSIRNIFDKGVDATIKENKWKRKIDEHKKRIGYIQAVDQKMEDLSADEQKKLEEQNNEQSGVYRDGDEDNAVQ